MNEEFKREYYRAAADRWMEGVRLQVRRCLGEQDGDMFFDSNFLVVAVARLREVARMTRERLGVSALNDAIERFDTTHPEFRDVREPQ